MNISSFLIGQKNNYNFSSKLIGSKRLKDYDKDGVPDRFDCQWRNSKKDATIPLSEKFGNVEELKTFIAEKKELTSQNQLAEQERLKQQQQIEELQRQQDILSREASDWDFAKNLVFKGKGFAAQGDTNTTGKLTSTYYKVKWLQEHGYRSVDDMVRARESEKQALADQQKQLESQKQVYYDALGQPMSTDPTKTKVTLSTTPKQTIQKPTLPEYIKLPEEPKTTTTIKEIPPSIISNIISPVKIETKPKITELPINLNNPTKSTISNTPLMNINTFGVLDTVIRQESGVVPTNLNYPTKSTISSQPTVSFITTSESKAYVKPSLINTINQAIQTPVNYITGLPSQKQPLRENEVFIYTPQRVSTPRKETISYAPPVLGISGQIEKERILTETTETFKLETKAKEEVNKIYNKYQGQLDLQTKDRSISEQELNKLLESTRSKAEREALTVIGKLEKDYKGQYTEREKERTQSLIKGQFSESFWERRTGDVIRAGIYAIPFIGTSVLISDVYTGIKEAPETFKFIQENPIMAGKEISSSILTFGIVGGGISKGKSMIKEGKVSEAINQADIITKSKGVLTKRELMAYAINEDRKLQLSKLIDKGYDVRLVEVSMEAKQGLEKYTPDVKGTFIQATDTNGNVGLSVSIGEIKAKLDGKSVKGKTLSQTLLKIEEGGSKGYTESVSRTGRNIELTRSYSENKITGVLQKDSNFLVSSESKTGLISKEKVKEGYEFFNKYERRPIEEYEKGSKPLSKGESKEFIQQKRTEGLRTGDEAGLLFSKETYTTQGEGVIRNIVKEPKKITKIKKVEEPTSLITGKREYNSREPSVNKKGVEYKESEIPKPKYVGGQGGVLSQGLYYGKSYLMPRTYESEFLGFVSKVPKAVTRMSYGGIIGTSLIGGTRLDKSEVNKGFNINLSGSGLLTRPTIKDLSGSGDKNKLSTSNRSKDVFSNNNLSNTRTGLLDVTKSKDVIRPTENVRTDQIQAPSLITGQTNINNQKLDLRTRQDFNKPDYNKPDINIDFSFKYPEEYIPKIPREDYKRKARQEFGYNAYEYVESTKKPYWRQINKEPLTQRSAVGVMAETVDNNISAKGKIKKVPLKKNEKPVDTNNDYFEVNKRKFRQFKQTKGVRTKIPNQLIELQKYRLDKPNEIRKISSSKRTPFGF
jgi:hypothetical protein